MTGSFWTLRRRGRRAVHKEQQTLTETLHFGQNKAWNTHKPPCSVGVERSRAPGADKTKLEAARVPTSVQAPGIVLTCPATPCGPRRGQQCSWQRTGAQKRELRRARGRGQRKPSGDRLLMSSGSKRWPPALCVHQSGLTAGRGRDGTDGGAGEGHSWLLVEWGGIVARAALADELYEARPLLSGGLLPGCTWGRTERHGRLGLPAVAPHIANCRGRQALAGPLRSSDG